LAKTPADIEYRSTKAHGLRMRHLLIYTALAACLATSAGADCYADYKAKQDNPLRLHYGVLALQSGCDVQSAQGEVRQRLAQNGWTLLNVLSVFGPEGLSERQASAGQYHLRF